MQFKNIAVLSTAGVLAAVALGAGGAAVAETVIGSHEIRDNSVRSIDIKDNSLKKRDLSKPVNRALDRITKDGVQGPEGPQGPQGPAGEVDTYVNSKEFVIPAGTNNKGTTGRISCNAGDVALGGGYSTNDHNANYGVIYQNRPDWNVSTTAPDAWMIQGYGGDADSTVHAWVICTPV